MAWLVSIAQVFGLGEENPSGFQAAFISLSSYCDPWPREEDGLIQPLPYLPGGPGCKQMVGGADRHEASPHPTLPLPLLLVPECCGAWGQSHREADEACGMGVGVAVYEDFISVLRATPCSRAVPPASSFVASWSRPGWRYQTELC